MNNEWLYAKNSILNATEGSFRLSFNVSLYHDAALQSESSDLFFKTMYDDFHPLHEALRIAYESWKAQFGGSMGETENLAVLMRQLRRNWIEDWDIRIQNVYKPKTAAYIALLPQRRKPFQGGGQAERINAVNSLSIAIGNDQNLAALKIEIDAVYAQLMDALGRNKGSKINTTAQSEAIEKARVNMCIGMYRNLGKLIDKYAEEPKKISRFFDLANLRTRKQDVYTGTLNDDAPHMILLHTFKPDEEITLMNNGEADIIFYLAANEDAEPIIGKGITLQAHEEKTIDGSQLGDLNNRMLMVKNSNALIPISWEIELL
jgi:hypothetical protein